MTRRFASFLALCLLSSCGSDRLTRSAIARELNISSSGMKCKEAIVATIADSAQRVVPCSRFSSDRDVQLLKDPDGHVLQVTVVWHAESSAAITVRDSVLQQLTRITSREPRLCTSDDGLPVRVWQLNDTEYVALLGGRLSERVRLILAMGVARCR
ncbi:MAG: hypothetical protein IT359_19935 [Gemmatimonadaceae bacterium]|nr:hypothetical protein [Gemmatimonadaceae bacterium]